MPPCLRGRAMVSQPRCDVLPWLEKTYRGPIDADHHQIVYIGQQNCRSLVRAYIVHKTETPFTLSRAARDGRHASYEWFKAFRLNVWVLKEISHTINCMVFTKIEPPAVVSLVTHHTLCQVLMASCLCPECSDHKVFHLQMRGASPSC